MKTLEQEYELFRSAAAQLLAQPHYQPDMLYDRRERIVRTCFFAGTVSMAAQIAQCGDLTSPKSRKKLAALLAEARTGLHKSLPADIADICERPRK